MAIILCLWLETIEALKIFASHIHLPLVYYLWHFYNLGHNNIDILKMGCMLIALGVQVTAGLGFYLHSGHLVHIEG